MSFFKSLFKLATKIAPVAIGFALGGPVGAAVGGAAGSALRGGDVGQIIQGGLYGYGGGTALSGLSAAAGAYAGAPAVGTVGPQAGGIGSALSSLGGSLTSALPSGLGGTSNPLLSLANLGSTAYSALSGSAAANKASAQQLAALQKAQGQQTSALAQAQGNVSPYLTAGAQSAAGLAPLVNDPNAQAAFIKNSPFYEAMANDAKNKLFANAAAKGKLGTGGTAEALQNSLLLLGDSLLNSDVARKQGVASLGANTATSYNNLLQSGTNNLTNLTADAGNAAAAGTIGSYNATTGAINNGLNTAAKLYGVKL